MNTTLSSSVANVINLFRLTSISVFMVTAILILAFSVYLQFDPESIIPSFIIGSVSVPFLVLDSLFSFIEILLAVMLLIITQRLSKIYLHGHMAHIFHVRLQNRLLQSACFLIVPVILILGISLPQYIIAVKSGLPLSTALLATLAYFLMYLYVVVLVATFINFRQTRPFAILFTILILVLVPMMIELFRQFLITSGFLSDLLGHLLYGISFVSNPVSWLSDFRNRILHDAYTQYPLFWSSLPALVLLLTLNGWWFRVKDMD